MAKYTGSDRSLHLNVYIEQGTQNIADNSTTVNWWLTVSRSGNYPTYNKQGDSYLSLKLDGQSIHSSYPIWETSGEEYALANGSTTINHNADGRKSLPVSCTFTPNNGIHGTITVNVNITLTDIPRGSSPSVGKGVIGSSLAISINRHNSSFTHNLRYEWGRKSGTIATNVSTNYSWLIPSDFASEIPNSTSGAGVIYVDTYNGTRKIGTQQTSFTASVPNNLKPTFTGLNLVDLNGVTRELLSGNNFLQVVSDVQVNFVGATGSYGSTIKGYRAEIVNKKMVINENGGSFGIMNFNGSVTIRASVFDSRGKQSDTKDITINVIEYYAPSFSFSALRTRGNPNTLQVLRNARIAPITQAGQQRNTMALSFKVAQLGNSNYTVDNGSATGIYTTVHTLTNSAANLAGNYPANKSFHVIGKLEDKFTSVEFAFTVATESVVMSYDKNGRVGIGKVAEFGKPGSLDVLGDIHSNNKPIQQYQLTDNAGGLSRGSAQWDDVWNKKGTEFGWRNGKYPDNPTGNDWGLFQNYWLDSWKGVQFFTGITSNRFFFRTYNSGNRWAPTQWKEIATKDDIQSTTWQNLPLQNGWNHHQQYNNVQYSKTFDGVIYLRGSANKGKIANETVIGTLPVGFRPTQTLFVSALNNSYTVAVLGIYSNGNIVVKKNVDSEWLNFDNVSFKI
jgi:hypothetical protein